MKRLSTHLAEFTDAELDLLDTWKQMLEDRYAERIKEEGKTFMRAMDQEAARRLKIAEATVRSRRSRMKTKYDTAIRFTRKFRGWQQFFFQKTGGKFNPLSVSGRAAKK